MVIEKQHLILSTIQQLDGSVEREILFKKIKGVQEGNNMNAFDIKQRTTEHFYCEELGVELQKLAFWGLVSLDTKWNGEGFVQYYKITEYGETVLQETSDKKTLFRVPVAEIEPKGDVNEW